MFVTSAQKLAELTRDLVARGSFALDTEFIRERTYHPRLCLIQIATPDAAAIVDPLAVRDLGPLLELISDPAVEKVVHSGEQDMEIFFALGKRTPRNVVDVQVAAALAGLGESPSYARLVESLCGIRLGKVETYTDWSRRPLTPEQTSYALDDVRYLYPVLSALRSRLSELGRLGWLGEELSFYEDVSTYVKDPREHYRRVRGAGRLEGKDLAVLRELAAWREAEAEAIDWPRGRVIQDDLLVEVARRAPKTFDSLRLVRGIHPQLVARSGKEILRRVSLALQAPRESWPEPLERGPSDPELDAIVDLLDVLVRVRAFERGIAPGYLATRKQLSDLVRRELGGKAAGDAEAPHQVLLGWRRALVGEALLDLLHGRTLLGVELAGGRVLVETR